MPNEISDSGMPLTSQDVQALEKRLGFALPGQYRAFLLRHNGGVPKKDTFDFEEGDYPNSSDVNKFFGVGIGGSSIEHIVEVFRGRMPPWVLPIGMDSGGNLICISVVAANSGAIYFWDHEQETQPARDQGLWKISDSFEEFFANLYEYVPPANALRDELYPLYWTDDADALAAKIDAGLDLNDTTAFGMTLLENAILPPREKIATMLLLKGANHKKALADAIRFKKTIASQDEAFQRIKAMLENIERLK